MSERAVHQFIATVSLHFHRPKFNGDETMEGGWMASMNRLLGQYPDEVLGSVADKIVRERTADKGRFFPLPSEICDLCNEVMEQRRAHETPLLTGREPPPFAEERFHLARDLMKTPLGKQAAREGWGPAMFEFCVRNRKAPLGKEIDDCKAKDRKFKEEYERCLRGERALGGAWARLAESMVAKARELMEKPA